jgi:hypothetical protein
VDLSWLDRSLLGTEGTRKKSKFSEQQIAYALRPTGGGDSVGDVCRQLGGVPEARYYVWKKKCGKCWGE